jgi:dTDP-4-dehydrorhamnose reductase
MSRVAIAGGTGGLGRTITGAIIATGKHAVFVLTRGVFPLPLPPPIHTPPTKLIPLIQASTSALSTSITQLPTDYTNSTAIASILKTHNIDTIISTLHTNTEAQSQAQLVLIEAAVLSETVVRFAPSEYGIDFLEAARL